MSGKWLKENQPPHHQYRLAGEGMKPLLKIGRRSSKIVLVRFTGVASFHGALSKYARFQRQPFISREQIAFTRSVSFECTRIMMQICGYYRYYWMCIKLHIRLLYVMCFVSLFGVNVNWATSTVISWMQRYCIYACGHAWYS